MQRLRRMRRSQKKKSYHTENEVSFLMSAEFPKAELIHLISVLSGSDEVKGRELKQAPKATVMQLVRGRCT